MSYILKIPFFLIFISTVYLEPTFFSASSKLEKIEIIDSWLDETVRLAGHQRLQSMTGGGFMDTYIVGFKDVTFKKYFGKPYLDLKKGERKKIHGFLTKGYRGKHKIYFFLKIPFRVDERSADFKNWHKSIKVFNDRSHLTLNDIKNNKTKLPPDYYNRALPRCEVFKFMDRPYHNSCEKILETDSYLLYWSYRGLLSFTSRNSPCSRDGNGRKKINLSLVYKNKSKDFKVVLNEDYKRMVENEVLKAIEIKGCYGNVHNIYIGHYLDGAIIPKGIDDIIFLENSFTSAKETKNYQKNITYEEVPLCSTKITLDNRGNITYDFFSITGNSSASLNGISNLKIRKNKERQKERALSRYREKLRREKANKVIGYIVSAFILNTTREFANEAENDMVQALSILGRNYFLELTLKELQPNLSNSEIGYLNRFITSFMEGDFSPSNWSRDVLREYIIQETGRIYPEAKLSASSIDLMAEVMIQRRVKNKK